MLGEAQNEWLRKYANKLEKAPLRKRGNDSSYLKLVESVKYKRCAVCGCTKGLQLHHMDGNWRNPWLHNVEWLCKPHHREADRLLSQHKERKVTKKRIKWSPDMINRMSKFYSQHVLEGKTLDWCHTNFRSEAGGKYTTRYHSNKGAYNKYVLHTKPFRYVPANLDRLDERNARDTQAKAGSAPTITLSQILEYKKIAEAAGYKFILT